MRLQTKIVLTILPLTALSIFAMGFWSVSTIKQSMEKNLRHLMVQEIEDFVAHTITRNYNILEKNGLTNVESFVNAYQKEVFEQADGFHLLESGNFFIIHQSGNILKQTAAEPVDKALISKALNKFTNQGEKYSFGHFEEKDKHTIFAFSFFKPWQWTLVYTISHDSVHKAQDRLIKTAVMIAGGCSIIISLIIIFIFRAFFVVPITYLTETAAKIARFEDTPKIDIHSKDELDALARSMESMAASIKDYRDKQQNWQQFLESEIHRNTRNLNEVNTALTREIKHRKGAERVLRKSEERFKAIFESTTDCILVWDKSYNYLYANQAAIDHVGTTRDKVIGKNIQEGLGHVPEFMKLWMDRVDRAFEIGESFRVEDEMMIEDQPVHSESVVSPILDPDGTIFAVGVVYRDVSGRKQMEQQISEALDLNQNIISASSLGILAYKQDGSCVLANEASAKIIGADINQVLAQNFNKIPSWINAGLTDVAYKVIQDGVPQNFEMKTVSSFDKPVWLDIRLTRFNLNGKSHLMILLDDIYERKQLEKQVTASLKEKEILLQEIHHRVKNNLQVVSGLLKMQASKTDDPKTLGIFKDGQGQILSMALVHEQLYNSKNLARINFGSYLRGLIQSLQVSYGIDTRVIETQIDCPPIFIGIDTAIPCGLIINELVTNSFKYAFTPDRHGEIHIAFHLFEENEIQITVNDTGRGLPADFDISETRSLGLKLVYNLVTHQLEGDINLLPPPGTNIAIAFPYADHIESQRVDM